MAVQTYRFAGHYIGDPQVYRDREEARRRLLQLWAEIGERGELGLSDEEWEELDAEVTEVVEESVRFSKEDATDPPP